MEFFLIFFAIGFTLALIFMTKITQKKIDYRSFATEKHTLHTWIYNNDNKMQCSVCKQLASLIKTDDGEY